MNYQVRFVDEIEEDLYSAYSWYEGKSHGLGEDFLRVFYAKITELSRMPSMYEKLFLEFRRCLLRRFPYSVYYIIENDTIVIYGLFHTARDPKFIQESLHSR